MTFRKVQYFSFFFLGIDPALTRGDDAAAEADDAEEDEPARVERRERRPVDELIVAWTCALKTATLKATPSIYPISALKTVVPKTDGRRRARRVSQKTAPSSVKSVKLP